jgi:hypothetical protein
MVGDPSRALRPGIGMVGMGGMPLSLGLNMSFGQDPSSSFMQWGKFQPFALSTYVCLSIHRMFVDVTDRKKIS